MDYVFFSDSDEDIIFIPPPIENLSNNGLFQEVNSEQEKQDKLDELDEQLSTLASIELMQVDENSTISNDDVVFIPGPKPPLYILNSSEDEQIDESDSSEQEKQVKLDEQLSTNASIEVMQVNENSTISNDDDEDVVFIPGPKPPLYILDSSGDEQIDESDSSEQEQQDKLDKQLSTHASIEVMQVDENSTISNDDDADVVFIPGPKPPLYILDSSGDEQIDESDGRNYKTVAVTCDLLEPKLLKKQRSLRKRKSTDPRRDLQDRAAILDVATNATKRTKKVAKNLERDSHRVLLKKQKSSGTHCGSKESEVVCNDAMSKRTKRDSTNVNIKRISCNTLCEYNQKPSMNIYIDVHSSFQQLSHIDTDATVMKTPTNLLEINSNNCGNIIEEENWDQNDAPQNNFVKGGDQNWRKNNEFDTYFGEKRSNNTMEEENWENCEDGGNQNYSETNESNRNFVDRSRNNYGNFIEQENWDEDDESKENCGEGGGQHWGKAKEQNQPSNENFVERSSSNWGNTIKVENWDESPENSVEKANIGRNNSNDWVCGKSFNIYSNKGCNNDKQTNDPNEWSTVQDDVNAVHSIKRGPTWFNCRERGHRLINCPQPRKPISCYTCGHKGHSYTRCPNAICLKCGEKTDLYSRGCKNCQHLTNIKCTNCGVRGHEERNCSDIWRRYHNTINTSSMPHPLPIPKSTKYCSVCAGVGHTAEFCYDAFELLGEDMPSTRIRKYGSDYKTNITNNRATKPFQPSLEPSRELSVFESLEPKSRKLTFKENVGRNEVKMVVNSMNSKNDGKRTKMKNPFSKKFRLALSTPISESHGSSRYDINFGENHITTKKKVMTEAIAHDALMQEAIEIDKLRCPAFKSKIDESSQTTRKMKELTYMERTLYIMKKRLNTILKSADKIKVNINATENKNLIDQFGDGEKTNGVNLHSIQLISTVIASNNDYDERTKSDKPIMEKKIFLTKDHSRLLTEGVNSFLCQSTNINQIKVVLEHESINDTLTVVGTKDSQDKFHANLIEHLERHSYKEVHLKNEIFQLLPKSREGLIAFIREQVHVLEQPWDDLDELYKNMQINENLKCESAHEIRKQLNVNLFGRAGLRDGRAHVVGLQNNLKVLLTNAKAEMSKELWKDVYEHYRYIFSSNSHDNYPELISKYNKLKKIKSEPQCQV